MGTTIREVVFDIGGGIRGGKKFKAVQIGGPSGGATTASQEHLDLPLDFDSLKSIGAMIGSGGLVVMDEDTCMVETARLLHGVHPEGVCGKCVPCREGTKRNAGDPGPDHRQQGHPGGPGPAGGAGGHHQQDRPVRPGPERLQARPEHPEILQG